MASFGVTSLAVAQACSFDQVAAGNTKRRQRTSACRSRRRHFLAESVLHRANEHTLYK